MDESLKRFLEAWDRASGVEAAVPSGEGVDAQSSEGADGIKKPVSEPAGAQAGNERVEVPALQPSKEVSVQPQESPVQPQKEIPAQPAEEEVEGEFDVLPELNVEELVADIDELQFLTSPKAAISEIARRIDSRYRQAFNQMAEFISQLSEWHIATTLEFAFYMENPDLIKHKALVNEVVSKLRTDPRWQSIPLQQRMELLAQTVREQLKAQTAVEGTPPVGVVRGAPMPVDEQRQKVSQFVNAILKQR